MSKCRSNGDGGDAEANMSGVFGMQQCYSSPFRFHAHVPGGLELFGAGHGCIEIRIVCSSETGRLVSWP